jgi:hypothetical protein
LSEQNGSWIFFGSRRFRVSENLSLSLPLSLMLFLSLSALTLKF